jgi:hypothetical protein
VAFMSRAKKASFSNGLECFKVMDVCFKPDPAFALLN